MTTEPSQPRFHAQHARERVTALEAERGGVVPATVVAMGMTKRTGRDAMPVTEQTVFPSPSRPTCQMKSGEGWNSKSIERIEKHHGMNCIWGMDAYSLVLTTVDPGKLVITPSSRKSEIDETEDSKHARSLAMMEQWRIMSPSS